MVEQVRRKIRIVLFCLLLAILIGGLMIVLFAPLELKLIGILMLILGTVVLAIVVDAVSATYEKKVATYVPPPPDQHENPAEGS